MNEARPLRPVLLVADDFAFTESVSATIVDLIAKSRLSATSAMTNRPHWAKWARPLREHAERADAGVHLNLTAGAPLGPMPVLAPEGRFPALRVVGRLAVTSAAARREIADEFARQIEAFTAHYGARPAFLDGHQHVHALPGVRGALFRALERFGRDVRPHLRDPADTPGRITARGVAVAKAHAVAALAAGFGRTARRHGFPVNHGFAGFSPFDPARDFRQDFRRFLMAPGRDHLVMVHPGAADDAELAALDTVVATRPQEAAYLASDAFLADLADLGVRLGRVADQA